MTTLDTQLAVATAEAERLRQLAAERDTHAKRLRELETDEAARKAAVAARAEAAKALPPSRITAPRKQAIKLAGQYQSARVALISGLRDLNDAIGAEHDEFIAAGFDMPAGVDHTTGARRDLTGPTVVRDGTFSLTVNIPETLGVIDNRVDTAQLGLPAFTPQAKLPRVAQIVDPLPAPPVAKLPRRPGADVEFPAAEPLDLTTDQARRDIERRRARDDESRTVTFPLDR